MKDGIYKITVSINATKIFEKYKIKHFSFVGQNCPANKFARLAAKITDTTSFIDLFDGLMCSLYILIFSKLIPATRKKGGSQLFHGMS